MKMITNQAAIEHVRAHNIANGYGEDLDSVMETLKESDVIYSENVGSHRWYDDEFRVVSIDGKLVGYCGFYMTGDDSASDMDLKSKPEDVCFVEKKEVTVTKYFGV